MSFRLEGEVKDWKLFESYMDAGVKNGGRVFYREDEKGAITEAVYFSGAKIVAYTGEITEEASKIIRAHGYKVKEVNFNAEQGILKIVQ